MCKFSHIPVGASVNLNITATCGGCNQKQPCRVEAIYQGHKWHLGFFGDVLAFTEASTCPYCGYEGKCLIEPCEDLTIQLPATITTEEEKE